MNRRRLVTMLLLFAMVGANAAERPPHRPKPTTVAPRKGRDTIVLDGEWRMRLGIPATPALAKAIPATTESVWVPSMQTGAGSDAWYWRSIAIPATWKGQTVQVRFGAVADNATVWINGTEIGSHTGAFTPFDVNATSAFVPGQTNIIAVHAKGETKRGVGIWQGVMLVAHDEAYIGNVVPVTDDLGHLNANVSLVNLSKTSGDALLNAVIVRADAPKKPVAQTHIAVHVTPGENVAPILATIKQSELARWSPASPTLYRLDMSFGQGLDILDTTETTFGYRQIGLTADPAPTLTINGIATLTVAISLETDKLTIIATTADVDLVRGKLQRMKAAGVSVIYVNAPPPSLLNVADEIGMLVVEESGSEANEVADLHELIVRDCAHPSIIGWSLRTTSSSTITAVQEQDPSRLVIFGNGAKAELWASGSTSPIPVPPGLTPVKSGNR